MTVTLRQAETGDIEAMLDVWIDAFGPDFLGGRGPAGAWLRWALSENPAGADRWGYVAEKDGLVVAAWLNLPCRFRVGERSLDANWLCSTAVSSQGQRQGIGRKIYRRIVAENDLTLGVGVEAGSRALYESENVTFVPASALFERPSSLAVRLREVARDVKNRAFGDAARHARGLASSVVRRGSGVEMRQVARFSDDLRPLLEAHGRVFSVGVPRSVEWLNWIASLPVIEVSAYELRRAGALVGCALVRSDGLILDLVVHPDSMPLLGAMLLGVIDLYPGRMMRAIVPSAPGYRQAFERAGFRRRLDFGLFFVPTGEDEIDRICARPENWYLTFADSDTYTFRADLRMPPSG